MNTTPVPESLLGFQLVRLDRIRLGDLFVEPDTAEKQWATEASVGVFVDDHGREAGGSYVYRLYAQTVEPPADLAGYQNVRSSDSHVEYVRHDDRLVGSRFGVEFDGGIGNAWPTGQAIDRNGEITWFGERVRVYRKIPVAKQGLANDGTVLKNDQAECTPGEQYLRAPESKHTNPKDAIGSGKLPLDLVPETAIVYMALAFLEGGLKYGAFNWRAMGVRSSIYYAACRRHLIKWWNGEWQDAKTGVPHLASALACIAIILDADSMKKLTDDRPVANPGLSTLIDHLGQDQVTHLKELFKDENPKHWTIKDTAP